MQVQRIQKNNIYNPNFQAFIRLGEAQRLSPEHGKNGYPITEPQRHFCINSEYLTSYGAYFIDPNNETWFSEYIPRNKWDENMEKIYDAAAAKKTMISLADGSQYIIDMPVDRFENLLH